MNLSRGLKVVRHVAPAGKDFGIVERETVLRYKTFLSPLGEFREAGPEFFDPFVINDQGEEVRFRKITVIMSKLFRTHGAGHFTLGVPEPGLLDKLASLRQNLDLPVDLIFQGLFHRLEGVHILDLDLGAQLAGAPWAHGDVGVAAEGAFLHIAVADLQVLQGGSQVLEIAAGLFRAGDVGLADDLHKRNPGPV